MTNSDTASSPVAADSGKRKALEAPHEKPPPFTWTDAQTDNLLKALVKYRSIHNETPKPSTIDSFCASYSSYIPSNATGFTVSNKIRSIRARYNQFVSKGMTGTPLYKVASQIWPPAAEVVDAGSDDDKDASQGLEFVSLRRNMLQYFTENGRSERLLEEGLRALDPVMARALDKSWQKQNAADLKLSAKQCALDKELMLALAGTSNSK